MSDVKMTQTEWNQLGQALVSHFGGCTCRALRSGTEYCAGHRFLSETDRVAGRIDKLLWIRRTLPMWQSREWLDLPKQAAPGPAPIIEQAAPDSVPW